MERDLAVIRSKRAERERAAGALKAPSPIENLEHTSGEQAGIAGETSSSVEESDKPKLEDLIMIDVATTGNHETINLETMSKNSAMEKTISASKKMPRDTDSSKGLAISIDPHSETATLSLNGGTKEHNHDDLSEQRLETPTTANLRDTDFETMFNDTETAGGDDGMNFDLTFTSDVSMGQELVNSTSLQDVSMGNTGLTNFNGTSDEHINTISPGLDNFVAPIGDFTMVGEAPAKNLPESDSRVDTTAAATAPQNFGSAQIESSFDDLFTSDGFIEDPGDYGMAGDGSMGDLADIDDWFKPSNM